MLKLEFVYRHKKFKGLNFGENTVNPFHATDLFMYPLEKAEKPDVFRRYRKRINLECAMKCVNHDFKTLQKVSHRAFA